MTAHIITANHLETGAVVYLNQLFDWTTEYEAARILTSDSEVEEVTRIIERAKIGRDVVGIYTIDVESTDENTIPFPVRLREQIRVQGPTSSASSDRAA